MDIIETYNISIIIDGFGNKIVNNTKKKDREEKKWIKIDKVNKLFNNTKNIKVVLLDLLELYL